jgi:GTPase SAR1 family protein
VYDLTDSHTFFKIEDWLDKVEENKGCEEVAMMLVGNKLDKD